MKKLIALIISIILVIPSISIIASAAPEVEITFPASNATIDIASYRDSFEYSDFQIKANVALDAEHRLYLDGVEIDAATSSGELVADVDISKLYVGKHTAELYAISPDGSVGYDKLDFTIKATRQIIFLKEDFESLDYDEATDKIANNKLPAGMAPAFDTGVSGGAYRDIGVDSTGSAMRFSSQSTDASKSSAINIQMNEPYASGLTTIEFDLKFNSATNGMAMEISGGNFRNDAKGIAVFPGSQAYLFSNKAEILGPAANSTTNSYGMYQSFEKKGSYAANDWMKLSVEMDYTNKSYNVKINGNPVLSAIPDPRFNLYQISDLRYFIIRNRHGAANTDSDFTMDNFKIYNMAEAYTGIASVEAFTPSTSSTSIAGGDTNKFVVKTNEVLRADSTLTIKADGEAVAATVSYDTANKEFIVTGFEALKRGSRLEFTIDENQKTLDGNKTGLAAKAYIDVEPDDFHIADGEFVNSSGQRIISLSGQIAPGEDICYRLKINNATGEHKDRLIVMVVRDGDKIISISPLTVPSETGLNEYTVSAKKPAGASDVNVKVIVCDKWNSLMPLSGIYTLR